MNKLEQALLAEAEALDQVAAEYEKIATGSPERITAIIVFRGMAAAKRHAAAVVHDAPQ